MKIWKQFNKNTKKDEWKARFRINNKQFRPKADTRKELDKIISAIRLEEEREQINNKHGTNLPVRKYYPTIAEVFGKILPSIPRPKQKQFTKRVCLEFLALLPADLSINKLTTFRFQEYINYRQRHLGAQTNKPLKPQTINKELYAISGVLKKAPLFFADLENWTRPAIPFLKEEDSKRDLNLDIKDFERLLEELRQPRTGKQTVLTEQHRRRLADELEFRLETGLRRKEVARLQFRQYFKSEGILKNVRRWKTKTTTKVFPLTRRAIELIEARTALDTNSMYVFTKDGEPVESDYRTLKTVCQRLSIPYGRFTDSGFVPHDLRHQAGTETVRVTDIETARAYLGHSSIKQTTDYLHTDTERLKEAVRRRDELKQKKIDVEKSLKSNFEKIQKEKLTEKEFIEAMRKLFRF